MGDYFFVAVPSKLNGTGWQSAITRHLQRYHEVFNEKGHPKIINADIGRFAAFPSNFLKLKLASICRINIK